MSATSIQIQVDAETARAYHAASDEERQALDLLLALRLRDATRTPARSLETIMADASRHARAQGLTEHALADLLRDE